ncbi:MAG TPA: ABC transporter permease, partial [Anaerolineae bacterium]|nr:ABC transporter permease [Anaerolineae bacterium]
MLNPRWRKVERDLWHNKSRTLLVVLSIAVGVFAVGLIAGTQEVLFRDMTASFLASNPAHAVLFADPNNADDPDKPAELFDDNLIQAVRRMDEVQEAEGRTEIEVRLQIGSTQADSSVEEARELNLQAIGDYEDIRIWKIWPQYGAWPPAKHEFLLERASLDFAGAKVGDRVTIKTSAGKVRQLRLAGVVYDPEQASPTVEGGQLNGYISLDTLEWLGEARGYQQMNITVVGDNSDEEYVEQVTEAVKAKIENSGRKVSFTWLPTSDEHPASEVLQPMFFLLSALGFLSLLLSGFLVVNTLSALLTQQTRQIGIMKTIGASRGQIMSLYLVTVLIFGLLSLLIAVPLGALGASIFADYMAGLVNFDIASSTLTPQVLALEVSIGLIVPLLAALYPVLNGARLTVREAISSYGLGKGHFGSSLIDRLLLSTLNFRLPVTGMSNLVSPFNLKSKIENPKSMGLSRPVLLSLRNTFRRKGRLSLTLITLTLASAIFIAVFSVRASMLQTLDEALQYWNYDLSVDFDRPQRTEQIEREALRVPGVVAAESWGFAGAKRLKPDSPTDENVDESRFYFMIAPPAATGLLRPTLLAGRWLLPEDTNAVVINTDLLEEEPDLAVGDELLLELDERETKWEVVGLVRTTMSGPRMYVNYPYFAKVSRNVGRASSIQIVTERHDLEGATEAAKAVEIHFEQIGIKVSAAETIAGERERIETIFDIIVGFLSIMAVLLAVVGGLGLMGTMSINVLERIREIG